MSEKFLKVIGLSGLARSGKDTFFSIATKILNEKGYTTKRYAFADALKDDLSKWIKQYYNIDIYNPAKEEKDLIRPFLVAHGCGKRIQTNGTHWVEKIHFELLLQESIVRDGYQKNDTIHFITDVRFPNEADWLHKEWAGKLIHIRKYRRGIERDENDIIHTINVYDTPPNEEEAKNDPLVRSKSDVLFEWEDMINNKVKNYEELLTNEESIAIVKKCLNDIGL
jgi:hypothetical protein